MNTRKFISILSIFGLILSSCSDDDTLPIPVSPEEVITTMNVTLTAGTETITLKFFDVDGEDGPTAPVSTVSGSLSAGTTYTGAIELLNETEDPAEEVNEEIAGEADEHQFFYLTDDLGITTAYTDRECDYDDVAGCDTGNTNPLGITFTLTTTATTGDAELRVVLRHQPNKDAQGVSDGDITNAEGATDIDWTFDIAIQ